MESSNYQYFLHSDFGDKGRPPYFRVKGMNLCACWGEFLTILRLNGYIYRVFQNPCNAPGDKIC
jgi:hypothetical protein